jgi:hypothetical protein
MAVVPSMCSIFRPHELWPLVYHPVLWSMLVLRVSAPSTNNPKRLHHSGRPGLFFSSVLVDNSSKLHIYACVRIQAGQQVTKTRACLNLWALSHPSTC